MAILGSLVAAQPFPGAEVIARYDQVKQFGRGYCFQSLANGVLETGAKVIQAGTNANDFCSCVGELFATGTISNQLKDVPLGATPSTSQQAVLSNLEVTCLGRLSPSK